MAEESIIDKLIADNMGLIYKQLHKFNRINDDDAFSHALIGLMNAAKTYDESRNIAFSTYATTCIYNGIACYLRSLSRKKNIETVSYSIPVGTEGGLTLEDMISISVNIEEDYIKRERFKIILCEVHKLCEAQANPASKLVLRTWIDSGFSLTQVELAKITGVSQPHVSRTLSAFRHKLKTKLEELQW